MNPRYGADEDAPMNPYPYGAYYAYPYNPYVFPYNYYYPPIWGGPQQNVVPNAPNGANNPVARAPGNPPPEAPNMPASQLTNSTGGAGCEPGYNYFFPPQHTKIHVFKTPTPPWQLPAHAIIEFHACHVPVATKLADILKGFGATGPSAKKNQCFEVTQGGNGKWYKGLCFSGDDKDMMKKSIEDLGWDASRTGLVGQKPVVCLWLTKG